MPEVATFFTNIIIMYNNLFETEPIFRKIDYDISGGEQNEEYHSRDEGGDIRDF
jgi:hypothetical protein